MTFWRWLMAQRDRDDSLGDLACDAANDRTAPHGAVAFLAHVHSRPHACERAQEMAVIAVKLWHRESTSERERAKEVA